MNQFPRVFCCPNIVTELWVVKDADERFDNAMMLVHLHGDSGFVLLAVRGQDCQYIDPKWCRIYNKGGK
jgi:hypothetical protein